MFICYCAHLNIVWCECEGGGMLCGICMVSAYAHGILVSFSLLSIPPPPPPPSQGSRWWRVVEETNSMVLLSFLSPPPPPPSHLDFLCLLLKCLFLHAVQFSVKCELHVLKGVYALLTS